MCAFDENVTHYYAQDTIGDVTARALDSVVTHRIHIPSVVYTFILPEVYVYLYLDNLLYICS